MRFLLILVIWEIMIYCCLVYAYLCEYNFPPWNQNKNKGSNCLRGFFKETKSNKSALMSTFSKADPLGGCEMYKQQISMQWCYLNPFSFVKHREEMIKALPREMIIYSDVRNHCVSICCCFLLQSSNVCHSSLNMGSPCVCWAVLWV